MFYILHWIDKDNDFKDNINVFLNNEELKKFKEEKNLTEEQFFTEEYWNENANNKLLIDYSIRVLKRMKINKYKRTKNKYVEFESQEFNYELFKINEFWGLTKIDKDPNNLDFWLYQSTSLKKLLIQHYE